MFKPFAPRIVLVILMLLVSLTDTAAAKPALSLSGNVTNLKMVEESTDSLLLRLELDLTLRNDSQANAILYWHDFDIVGNLIFRGEERQNREVLYRISTLPSADRSPQWADLQKRMDLTNPSGDLTRTLRRGESVNLKRTTNLRIFRKGLNGSSWNEIRAASPVWLTVELDLFPANLDQTSTSAKSFGKKLQKKWKRFGVLQIEVLQSEPIRLDLSNL